MTIQSVTHDNRKKAFHVKTSKQPFQLPYSRVDLHPGVADPIVRVFVDKELRGEKWAHSTFLTPPPRQLPPASADRRADGVWLMADSTHKESPVFFCDRPQAISYRLYALLSSCCVGPDS